MRATAKSLASKPSSVTVLQTTSSQDYALAKQKHEVLMPFGAVEEKNEEDNEEDESQSRNRSAKSKKRTSLGTPYE